jgi:transposase
MPQIQLPIFPAGSVEINRDLACRVEGNRVVYFNGHLPVFMHDKGDLASFRMFTSQLIVQGSATQGDITKAFGVSLTSVKRGTRRYRQHEAAGFFVAQPRREGKRLNAEKLSQARVLLETGEPIAVVSQRTGVLADTLRKAIASGRLPQASKKKLFALGKPLVLTSPLLSKTERVQPLA